MKYLAVMVYGKDVGVAFRDEPFGEDRKHYTFQVNNYMNFEIRFMEGTDEVIIIGKGMDIYAFKNRRGLELVTMRVTLNNAEEHYLPWQAIFKWGR